MEAFNLTSSTLQALIFFLLPGFVAVYVFFYQIPDRKKSELTIIALSVVLSVVLNNATIYLFNFINFITSLKLHLTSDNPVFTWIKYLLAILFAIALCKFIQSKVFGFLNEKLLNVKVFPFGRLWNSFFKVPENTVIKIFLNNGICYVGVIHSASVDPEDDVQEIELWKPFYFDKATRKITRIDETESVLIQGSSILSIEKVAKENAKSLYK